MARGGTERKAGRRRHTMRVSLHAAELVLLRADMDGISGDDPTFNDILSAAEQSATELAGVATRMDRDGKSRRAACAVILADVTLSSAQQYDYGVVTL